jgi:hypothetical protein
MIVNELVTNAARHAFAGRKGRIRVELDQAGSFVTCKVQDSGASPREVHEGRGLRIIRDLAKALNGHFEQSTAPGGRSPCWRFRTAHRLSPPLNVAPKRWSNSWLFAAQHFVAYGTSLTWCHVRDLVAIGGKADVPSTTLFRRF